MPYLIRKQTPAGLVDVEVVGDDLKNLYERLIELHRTERPTLFVANMIPAVVAVEADAAPVTPVAPTPDPLSVKASAPSKRKRKTG